MQMIALSGWTSFPLSWKKPWMFTQNAMENVKSLFWRPQPTLSNPLAWPCHIYYPVVPRPRRGPLIPTMENGKALSFAYPHPPKTILLASSTRVAGTVCSLIAVLWKNLLSPQQLLCLCLPHLSPTTIWPTSLQLSSDLILLQLSRTRRPNAFFVIILRKVIPFLNKQKGKAFKRKGQNLGIWSKDDDPQFMG